MKIINNADLFFRQKKVFIGLYDIASCIDDWAIGFEMNNFKTLTGCLHKQAVFQNSKLDFIISNTQNKIDRFKLGHISPKFKPWWNKKINDYYFKKALKECDIFLFIWNSFYPDYSDYKILKEKGKKIITILVGDDVRWEPAARQEFKQANLPIIEYSNYDYSSSALIQRLTFMRIVEKFSDVIISKPNVTQLALRPYHDSFIPMIASNYQKSQEQRKIPIIIHAPTVSALKGTKYIESVLEKLRLEGIEFEYNRIEKMPRVEALEMYAKSDVIIDQLLLPGGGTLAHEGLALGKVVLTSMAYKTYDQKKSKDCPLVDVSIDTLYDVLKELIPNQVKRNEIAGRGRNYIEHYHHPKNVVNNILNHLNGSKIMDPVFYPTFFREHFIPESEETTDIYNKWNIYVKDCDWYKDYIKPGERAGLKF